MNHAPYPFTRPRRLRQSAWIRSLVQETRLHPSDLILPLFVHEGAEMEPIASLPGVSRHSLASLVATAKEAHALGIPALALFPKTDVARKSADGKEALNADNLVCRAIAVIKSAVPEIGIIADVALDPYTTHGHDGVLGARGDVDNDATVEILAEQALVLAKAGADVVAPSDMMDGRVGAIRAALESEGHVNTMILAYSAKYASSFYGPFRDAIGSSRKKGEPAGERAISPQGGAACESQETFTGAIQKNTYQMNPANGREALLEAQIDVAEGADMVMVKPALPYLDVVHTLAAELSVPVLAYQVSGEYAMLKHAASAGAFAFEAACSESLLAIKRAGARAILTYAALAIAKQA